MKEKVTISIDSSVLERLDGSRGLIPRSALIEDYVKRGMGLEKVDAGVV